MNMALGCVEGPKSVGHISQALLWVHHHTVRWDFSCILSVWNCTKSLDDATAPQVLCHIYLDNISKLHEFDILMKAYVNVWWRWIGQREIKDMCELLLHTLPHSSLAAMNTESNHQHHIGAFCSLHFRIEYCYGHAFTIFTGLDKLANLLYPADTGLQSFIKQNGASMTVADIKEVIAFTINFAITEHWSGAGLTILAENTIGILGKQLVF